MLMVGTETTTLSLDRAGKKSAIVTVFCVSHAIFPR